MNILSSTTVFSLYTLLSRILGYARDILIAVFLGASMLADAFFVAFRLPNTFRRLFAEGTFNAAFIPSFMEEKSKGEKFKKAFSDEVLSLLTIVLLILVFLVEIFTPLVVYMIAPGFIEDSEKFDSAVELARIMFPFLLFVCVSSFFSAILNSYNKFAAAAAAPILLNIILIVSLLYSYVQNSDYAYNLALGVALSGILQMCLLIYFSKKYYKPSLIFKKKISSKVKFFLKKLFPSILASGVTQINILVGTIIASFQAGAVSYLYYADRVYQINLAIAGIAVGVVSLPVLSNAVKKKDKNKVFKIQNKSLELALLLSIPATFGLIISSEEIVNSLFGYGSFDQRDVALTSQALTFFGYGMIAFALAKVLANFFFARDDTKTPFHISVLIVTLNILISIIFFKKIGFIIIPIATSISTWIGVILYLFILIKRDFIRFDKVILNNVYKICLSAIFMSFILIFGLNYFSEQLIYSNIFKFVYLLSIISFVALVYLICCNILGVLKIKKYKVL